MIKHLLFLMFLVGLISYQFSGHKKKGIVAEIISTANNFAGSENAAKINDTLEVNRLKNLIMNPELLDMSIRKSKFPHTIEELKQTIFLDNPENTTIIDIYYNGKDTTGATAFLNTLLINLENFDVAPSLHETDKEIRRAQFQVDSMTTTLNGSENSQDSSSLIDNENVYENLLQKKASLIIARAGIVSSIRILFWARPVFSDGE